MSNEHDENRKALLEEICKDEEVQYLLNQISMNDTIVQLIYRVIEMTSVKKSE